MIDGVGPYLMVYSGLSQEVYGMRPAELRLKITSRDMMIADVAVDLGANTILKDRHRMRTPRQIVEAYGDYV